MMKKILIGCGIVALLVTIICCGAGIYGFLLAQRFGQSMEAAGQRIEKLEAAYPWAAPADLKLTEKRLTEFFAARADVVTVIEKIDLVRKLRETPDGQQPQVGFGTVFSFIGEMPGALEGFATAMESRQMSPREYFWTMAMIHLTIVQGAEAKDPAMVEMSKAVSKALDESKQIATELNKQNNPQFSAPESYDEFVQALATENVKSPESNYPLVARYKKELTEDKWLLIFELIITTSMIQNHGLGLTTGQGTIQIEESPTDGASGS